MGFMLLGLLSGVVDGNRLNAVDAYTAAMFYTIVYVLMSVGAFGMLLLPVARRLRVREPRGHAAASTVAAPGTRS